MNRYSTINIQGYEKVVRCDNSDVGFTAWIAIHNSNRGPALGGCRVWNYSKTEDAIFDVLRLSKGMTYKNSLARLPLGGGKSVVHADINQIDRVALFSAMGRFVDTLDGRYITAEDVNTTVEDMAVVKQFTPHVATVGASGNPSPFTAYGVYCGIKACVRFKYGRDTLKGLTVAVQGVGETGGRLAEMMAADGCTLIVSDINPGNIARLRTRCVFTEVAPEEIYSASCDILSPCALGGTINATTIPRLKCAIIAGSANNQLLEENDGGRLFARNILYAPDYAINAGGVINISCEIGQPYNEIEAKEKTARIGDTVTTILHESRKLQQPTNLVANRMAEDLFGMQRAA